MELIITHRRTRCTTLNINWPVSSSNLSLDLVVSGLFYCFQSFRESSITSSNLYLQVVWTSFNRGGSSISSRLWWKRSTV